METAVREGAVEVEVYTLPLVVRMRPAVELSDDQFFELCQINRELRIERTAEGDVLLMTPAGGSTGAREAEITRQVANWAKGDGTGTAFGPSAGFTLPNGAVRAPDASWMPRARLDQISVEQWEKFIPACPDFVVELRSPSDRLADLQAKMREYLANGARLGWLLDPKPRHAYVYRPDAPVERVAAPETLAGDPVLPGFVLELRDVW